LDDSTLLAKVSQTLLFVDAKQVAMLPAGWTAGLLRYQLDCPVRINRQLAQTACESGKETGGGACSRGAPCEFMGCDLADAGQCQIVRRSAKRAQKMTKQ
jgi:hypothetical protein